MLTTMTIILIIISFCIIVTSLLMSPDAVNSMGSIVGSSDLDLFQESKDRGAKIIFKRAMLSFGIVLMIVTVVLKIYL
ncbi:MAG: preprotein translocase subunit SecG [Mycoplasma sp.]|nr:preprotein translocase subunit SecG [Mycoplasma sp.]